MGMLSDGEHNTGFPITGMELRGFIEKRRQRAVEERAQWNRVQNELVKQGKWITGDSRVLTISKMETSHIQKCLNIMRERTNSAAPKYCRLFESELIRRRWYNRIGRWVIGLFSRRSSDVCDD